MQHFSLGKFILAKAQKYNWFALSGSVGTVHGTVYRPKAICTHEKRVCVCTDSKTAATFSNVCILYFYSSVTTTTRSTINVMVLQLLFAFMSPVDNIGLGPSYASANECNDEKHNSAKAQAQQNPMFNMRQLSHTNTHSVRRSTFEFDCVWFLCVCFKLSNRKCKSVDAFCS